MGTLYSNMATHVGNLGPQKEEQLLPLADRKFYDIPSHIQDGTTFNSRVKFRTDPRKLCEYIEGHVVGKDKIFSGPFGLRKVVYCDYTASGRSLDFIEDYIREQVLPDYGNTHTTTTVTSLQSTLFRHEARDIIRNAVNASEHDAVLFTGSGCTAAVHKLIHALDLKEPPVVFVGPFEHHSNLLPWKEIGAQVIRIPDTEEGLVDVYQLENELKAWQPHGHQLIGCFSAVSNVTGILTDVNAVTILLHQYGALAFWDYATAGPYMKIDMNPVLASGDQSLVYKDAVFISPHKFVGGVQTPGVLVAKKSLFKNPVPSGCGGGSVFFVRRDAHRYLQETEMREEGGTPAIVESVRAGLVFQLKEAVTTDVIMEQEQHFCRKALSTFKTIPSLVILGSTEADRLPVFSFLIKHPNSGLFLHHNFVCAVLNDLFGIQSRGGCACAGPYAQDLLGIDEELATKIENILVEDRRLDRVHLRRYREYSDREILRPGFSRINLPYFMKEEEVDFVLEAVKLVAEQGWKLLPQYIFNPETGEWRHRNHQVFKDRKWLGNISYANGKMTYSEPQFQSKGPLPENYQALEEFSMLQDGDRVLVCLSGGKDSLSLLHTIRQYQFYAKKKGINFEFGAVTVDPQTASYDPSPLKGYLASLDVPYFYEEQCILETAQNLPYECASICSFCSRMKRGRLYHAARRESYNVLAMGQHLDDLAESFMISIFHNGLLRTMKANYTVQEGDLRVIRPFVYVREKDLRMFAEQNKLPVIAENCPACFEAPKERHRMKQLLAAQEVLFPRLYSSILSAIKPILSISKAEGNVAKIFSNLAKADPQFDEADL